MSLPVVSQPGSEARHALDQLLLLLDPGRHDLLLLDDLVHEVFGRVQEWAGGVVVSLHVLALASGDVLELAAGDGILDSLVG